MSTSPDLPTPITPDSNDRPADLPTPKESANPIQPSSPFTLKPERSSQSCAFMRMRAHPNFMRAASYHWPAFVQH